MKMRLSRVAVLVSCISLLLVSTTTKADNTFVSFIFGYDVDAYESPYRYIYTPACDYPVSSPFFSGYTSHYYMVYPYYNEPVIYYRPLSPYYYFYAYQPRRPFRSHFFTYYDGYPTSYLYGFYPYNRYYPYYTYNRYYSGYPYKNYRFQHQPYVYRDGYRNKQRNAGFSKYSPENKLNLKKKPGPRDVRTAKATNVTNQQQRTSELEKNRSILQQQSASQATNWTDSRFTGREQRTIAGTVSRQDMLWKQNKQALGGINNREQWTKLPEKTKNNSNMGNIGRLIERNRNLSRSGTERNNRSVQKIPTINQQIEQAPKPQVNTLHKATAVPPIQARKRYEQQSFPDRLERPVNNLFPQRTSVNANGKHGHQRQLVREPAVRRNMEIPVNKSPSPGTIGTQTRGRQESLPGRTLTRKQEKYSDTGFTSKRRAEKKSSGKIGGHGMQPATWPKRSFAGAGDR